MSKKNTHTALSEGKGKQPRFNAAITEEELKLALAGCETWDSARPVVLDLLAKKSGELFQIYQGDADAAGKEWIDTMNLLTKYRAHLFQCLHMCSCAMERMAIIGEHLAQGMEQVEQPKPVVRIHRETVH